MTNKDLESLTIMDIVERKVHSTELPNFYVFLGIKKDGNGVFYFELKPFFAAEEDNSAVIQVNKDQLVEWFFYIGGHERTGQAAERVAHPNHYTWIKDVCGLEVIDITRHMNFNLGNSLKYILRAGHKKEAGMTDREKQIEDLKKAAFYINDEIERLQRVNEK